MVTPFAGVWIEITPQNSYPEERPVTPFAGVWIEIIPNIITISSITSLPSRECGLKSSCNCAGALFASSLPSRECGLKFRCLLHPWCLLYVTPFAGVWIEIPVFGAELITYSVTPFAGVWIEINWSTGTISATLSHSLRGSVD